MISAIATAIRRSPSSRSRAAEASVAAACALAVLALSVTSTPGAVSHAHARPAVPSAARADAQRPATTPGAAAPGAMAPGAPASQALYRIVGCRSRGAAVYRSGPHKREVAIGFDDGPWADAGAFVRMLERSRARATFFMIGRQLGRAYVPTLLRELRDGDALGDHTFTHPDLTRSGGVRGQLQRTIAAIRALSGYAPCVFRPPYGSYDASVVRAAGSLGLATVLWDVDPTDWANPGVGAIVRRVLAQVQPGSIVVSHDGGGPRGQTLAAYPAIIAALRKRGYRIVTIPELLGFRPVYAPCIRHCDGLGEPRAALPRDAIVRRPR